MENNKQIEFMNLYRPVHDKFERFCRARVYGEMEYEDLINESLLVAFEKFEKIKNKKAFLAFIFGTAIRVLANANRKKKPEIGLNPSQKDFEAEEKTDQLTEVNLLHDALRKIPDDQRESLILFEISGFSIKEISELLTVGESAIKQRLRRGRISLREQLTVKKAQV